MGVDIDRLGDCPATNAPRKETAGKESYGMIRVINPISRNRRTEGSGILKVARGWTWC